MGLLGLIGKVAGSKVVGKVEEELTKKQNREQTSKYCTYIKNNFARVCKFLADLQSETQNLIDEINSKSGEKMSLKEKSVFRRIKGDVRKNLQYLYLSRDFFTALSKNASGIALQNEELMMVLKFAPYFDGVPVLDIQDNEDDSIVGAVKEMGQELMSIFISTKKESKKFDFEEYLYRYEENFEKYVMPDIEGAIESFKNIIGMQETLSSDPELSASIEEIECSNCHTKLDINSKFCPECGNKIEVKKPSFCTQCGAAISLEAKFCANCGLKV